MRSVGDRAVKCGPVGTGTQNAACNSSDQCAPGYSCVSNGVGKVQLGVCLRSCCSADTCADPSMGGAKTSCIARSLAEGDMQGGSNVPLYVPVCAPVKTCNLLSPRGGGVCAENEICRLVDDQGATTCEPAGGLVGVSGERCPCAEGYVCLQPSDTCRKLCPLGSDKACGERGQCLSGGQALPPGVGICSAD